MIRLIFPGALATRGGLLCAVAGLSLASSFFLASVEAEPSGAKSLPPVGVSSSSIQGARIIDASLPGSAIDIAPWPSGGLAVLIADGTVDGHLEGPRSLYRLRGEASDVEAVLSGLDDDIDTVALNSSGSELWLGQPGLIQTLRGGQLHTVIDLAGVDLAGATSGDGIVRGVDGTVPLSTLGKVVFLGPNGLVPESEQRLPISARRTVHGLELSSLPARRLLDSNLESLGLAVGPEAHGARRLRSYLLDLPSARMASTETASIAEVSSEDAADGGEAREAWSRLPGPENVEQSWYRMIDGRPALIVTSTRSDKLGLFDKLTLRVFLLGADRTRAGRAPLFTLDTVTRRWFSIAVDVRDLDADGRDDLVLVQPEGLGAGKLFVDVYAGSTSGSFSSKPRRTKLELDGALWHYGSDLVGDATPDVAILREGSFEIYAGMGQHRKLSVERQPTLTTPTGTSLGEVVVEVSVGGEGSGPPAQSFDNILQAMDVDGDSRKEVVVVTNLERENPDESASEESQPRNRPETRAVLKVIGIDKP